MTCYPGKVLPGHKNLTHSVTTHVTLALLPAIYVTQQEKTTYMHSPRASSSLSNPSVPISSRHLCFSRSRHVGEAPVCAPRAPIRFTMTGMVIPNLHGNTVGNNEMAVKHTNVLLPRV